MPSLPLIAWIELCMAFLCCFFLPFSVIFATHSINSSLRICLGMMRGDISFHTWTIFLWVWQCDRTNSFLRIVSNNSSTYNELSCYAWTIWLLSAASLWRCAFIFLMFVNSDMRFMCRTTKCSKMLQYSHLASVFFVNPNNSKRRALCTLRFQITRSQSLMPKFPI